MDKLGLPTIPIMNTADPTYSLPSPEQGIKVLGQEQKENNVTKVIQMTKRGMPRIAFYDNKWHLVPHKNSINHKSRARVRETGLVITKKEQTRNELTVWYILKSVHFDVAVPPNVRTYSRSKGGYRGVISQYLGFMPRVFERNSKTLFRWSPWSWIISPNSSLLTTVPLHAKSCRYQPTSHLGTEPF